MPNSILLPSGLSLDVAKKDAKSLRRQDPSLSHSQSLDLICKKNGYSHGWNRYMSETKSVLHYAASTNPHRNLLIRAINHLVRNKLISLNAPKDYQEQRMKNGGAGIEKGHTFTKLDGREAVIVWRDIGHEELRVSIWWDYDHSQHPQADHQGSYKERFEGNSPLAMRSKYKNFVGVTCSGWLERQNGKYLQGEKKKNLFQIYTRTSNLQSLKTMKAVQPIGYHAEGQFYA